MNASEEGNETPSWLTESNNDTAPAAAPAAEAVAVPAPTPQPAAAATSYNYTTTNEAPAAAPAPAAGPADPEDLAAAEKEQLKGIILFTRVLNLGLSIAVITHSILYFVGLPKSPKLWVLSIYSLLGGCLICCLETQLKWIRTTIALNFGFLFDPSLRFMFFLLMASVEWSLNSIFSMILAGAFVGVAFYNTYILFKYPAYRKLRDELAKEEDARIQKKMRKQIQKEATKSMFASN